MIYYSFDPDSFEFKAARRAQIDPLTTAAQREDLRAAREQMGEPVSDDELAAVVAYLGHSLHETPVAPPPLLDKQAAIWRNSFWEIVPDHRGERWFDPYDAVTVSELGNPADKGWRLEPVDLPPSKATINGEAENRIVRIYPGYKQLNIMREGGAALALMSAYIDGVRASANQLEMTLPVDYRNDRWWPVIETGEA
jgi:hypothetical protein